MEQEDDLDVCLITKGIGCNIYFYIMNLVIGYETHLLEVCSQSSQISPVWRLKKLYRSYLTYLHIYRLCKCIAFELEDYIILQINRKHLLS